MNGEVGEAGGHITCPLWLLLVVVVKAKGEYCSETLLLGAVSMQQVLLKIIICGCVVVISGHLGRQMEGKGRGLGDKIGSVIIIIFMWELLFLWVSLTTTSDSDMFRDRHDPNEERNRREIRSFNRFSISREYAREGERKMKENFEWRGGECVYGENRINSS